MNKTISINLGGRNFFIEEDAYNKLNAYLNGIKAHFAQYQGSEEIVADMEGRIAEKFESKYQDNPKAVITAKDIDDLIAELGTVEDIAGEEGKKSGDGKTSGQQFSKKRLMRDADNKIIAGVCSGLAAYFDLDPIVFRLIFGVLLFAWGAIVPIYFLLWIIMPEAKSPTEKMQMRGEPLNLDSINETIKERAQEFKQHFNEVKEKKEWKKWGNDIKQHATAVANEAAGQAKEQAKSVAEEIRQTTQRSRSGFGNFIRQLVVGIGKIIMFFVRLIIGIVGLALVVSFSSAMAGLTVGVAVALFSSNSPYVGFPLAAIAHGAPYYFLLIIGYIIALIPLLFLLILASSLLTRRNNFKSGAVISLFAVWVMALAVGGIVGIRYVPGYVEQIKNSPQLQTVSKSYDAKDFKNLDLSNSGNFHLIQGKTYSVKASGWANDLDRLEVSVDNGTLRVSEGGHKFCVFCISGDPDIEITVPEINSITGHNSVSIFSSQITASTSQLTLMNSSHAKINYQTKQLTVELRNSSSANLSSTGTVDSLKAKLMNSSDLSAENLLVKDATITTGNSSEAHINVSGILNYDSFNSSQIYYTGNPDIQGNSGPFDNVPIPSNSDPSSRYDSESY